MACANLICLKRWLNNLRDKFCLRFSCTIPQARLLLTPCCLLLFTTSPEGTRVEGRSEPRPPTAKKICRTMITRESREAVAMLRRETVGNERDDTRRKDLMQDGARLPPLRMHSQEMRNTTHRRGLQSRGQTRMHKLFPVPLGLTFPVSTWR